VKNTYYSAVQKSVPVKLATLLQDITIGCWKVLHREFFSKKKIYFKGLLK